MDPYEGMGRERHLEGERLDAYIWLAYRLHSLPAPKLVTWKALKAQFGAGFKELYHFKNRRPAALKLALAVYPAARVEISEQGVLLRPSKPPVAPKQVPGKG